MKKTLSRCLKVGLAIGVAALLPVHVIAQENDPGVVDGNDLIVEDEIEGDAEASNRFSDWASQWSRRGDITLQLQGFTDNARHSGDHRSNLSVSGEAEFNRPIGENGNITISPFFRVDENDNERTHVDVREFIYRHSGDTWEVNVGIGKVFWGVTESDNIVDIINQRDAIEGLSPEYKLGQPMLNLLLLKDWGEISLFVLPGFRERTFAGRNGRPRGFFPVDTDNAEFESSNGRSNVDVAARLSGFYGSWDLGAHIFHGTAREPSFRFDGARLFPFYSIMTQVGFDAQATLESWLLKSELIHRSSDTFTDHVQLVTGLEYSFFSVAESNVDIGVISEWLFDDRRDTPEASVFQNDLLVGLRFALNDTQSTDFLMGVIADLDGGANTFTLEANRRIGDSFKLSLDAFIWSDAADDPILNQFATEDFLQLEFGYFF